MNLTEASTRRLRRVVSRIEHSPPRGGSVLPGASAIGARDPRSMVVKVTSTTATDGLYPSRMQSYETGSWADVAASDDSWFLPLSGTPAATDRYEATVIGVRAADGKPIWTQRVTGAGGGFTRQSFSNANYTVTGTVDVIVAQTGTMTAARTTTLPAASARAGMAVVVVDESNTVTATNKITVQRAGTDTVNGGTVYDLVAPRQYQFFESDGVSKWNTVSPERLGNLNVAQSAVVGLDLDVGGVLHADGGFEALVGGGDLNADVDDFLVGGAHILAFTPLTAARTITGFELSNANFLFVVNVGVVDLILAHQSGSSTVTNRIVSPTGANITLNPNESAILVYISNPINLWYIVSTNGA